MMDLKDISDLSGQYESSIFNMGLKPEYNIGEVSLAALYRQVGWQEKKEYGSKRFSESRVNKEATGFFKDLEDAKLKNSDDILENADWKNLISKSLSTPKMPNQVKTKNPILYPYVPDCAVYSSAARLRGNPWNPGNLIEKAILTGSLSKDKAKQLWLAVFKALSSEPDDSNEDILARIISKQFSSRRPDDVIWMVNDISVKAHPFDEDVVRSSPSHQFVLDIEKILILKPKLTRRQWLSILESLLRIGCASHILWLCNMNGQVWEYLRSPLDGNPLDTVELEQKLVSQSHEYWKLEEHAVSVIKEQVQLYIRSQIGINYILKRLESEGENVSLSSIKNISLLGDMLEKRMKDGQWNNAITDINDLYEQDPALIACKKGFTNSIYEFIRYSLGQKQTADNHKRNFDQSYWLRKKANYSAAPWIVDLGPVSILTMVYCCSHGHEQSRTIKDFLEHLGRYGFIIDQSDFSNSNMMELLSTLQVISDSPDAEGGMVILNPFN